MTSTFNNTQNTAELGLFWLFEKNNTNIQASNHQSQSSSKTESYNQSTTLASSSGAGTGAIIDNIVNAASIALGAGISKSNANSSILI